MIEHEPLRGHVVGVTADRSADEQRLLLGSLGASCLLGATVATTVRIIGDGDTTETWSLPDDPAPAETLVRAIVNQRLDAVTFTTPAAVDHLWVIADDLDLLDAVRTGLARDVVAACIDSRTGDRVAWRLGQRPVQPDQPTLAAMISDIRDLLAAEHRSFEVAGHQIAVMGRLVQVDSAPPSEMSPLERAVLRELSDRPGVVRSKEQLLDAAWPGRDASLHAVEMTVSRLRRRLGPAGVGVETVFRRGYRLAASTAA